jgi:DNA-binding PucR family transcriptional regulator
MERAAEVLCCHPNTVRYRLWRLQELTGRSLSDPHAAAATTTAAVNASTTRSGEAGARR